MSTHIRSSVSHNVAQINVMLLSSGHQVLKQHLTGVTSSILAQSHTFVEIDHEILQSVSSLPLIYSRLVLVIYKQKYVHELLVNCLSKLVQEIVWLGELTVGPPMTIAVDWDVKQQNKQTTLSNFLPF